jgi:hypothetical protein
MQATRHRTLAFLLTVALTTALSGPAITGRAEIGPVPRDFQGERE